MKNRAWIAGIIILALSATAAFTVLALQTPSQQADSPQASSDQSLESQQFQPFKEILAQKLGLDAEALEQAFMDAREEFEAQFADQNLPMGRMRGRLGDENVPAMRMRGHGHPSEMMSEMEGGHRWMRKTTVKHEFYQMGNGR